MDTVLPAWPLKLRVKEVDHSKFYFFDPGVVRALLNRLRDPADSLEQGNLLETYLFHELRAHVSSRALGGDFYYWGTHGGVEADFIWARGKSAAGFEVKSSKRWKSEYSTALKLLLGAGKIQKAFGVYLGSEALYDEGITVLPLSEFFTQLEGIRSLRNGQSSPYSISSTFLRSVGCRQSSTEDPLRSLSILPSLDKYINQAKTCIQDVRNL